MTFSIEVLLRDSTEVVSEQVQLGERGPAAWTDDDVRSILEAMLSAVARARDPTGERYGAVALRGLSWIVDSVKDGVMIAIEIPSAAVVAGPFDISQARLDAMVGRVIAASGPQASTVH